MKIATAVQVMKSVIRHERNVAIYGPHGVGKTETSRQVLIEEYGADGVKYLNGATTDVFIDIMGIPRNDKSEHLDFKRPLWHDKVRAILFDDVSRADKATRNALMEIINDRSVNGKPLPNLRCVWVTFNPYDNNGTYDVESLDPAFLDRFDVHIDVDPGPDPEYFANKFGIENAAAAINWWKQLPENLQRMVSSRRLDRAIDLHFKSPEIPAAALIPHKGSNPEQLFQMLRAEDVASKLKKAIDNKDRATITSILSSPSDLKDCKDIVIANMSYVLPMVSEECVNIMTADPQTWGDVAQEKAKIMWSEWQEKHKSLFKDPALTISNFEAKYKEVHGTPIDINKYAFVIDPVGAKAFKSKEDGPTHVEYGIKYYATR